MKKSFIVVLGFLCLLVISCQPKMKSGTITEKWYEPEQTYIILMPIPTGKSVILIPVMIYDNEDWGITVKGVTKNGDTVNNNYYIDRSKYDTLTVGQFICIDDGCSTEDNNNEKTR